MYRGMGDDSSAFALDSSDVDAALAQQELLMPDYSLSPDLTQPTIQPNFTMPGAVSSSPFILPGTTVPTPTLAGSTGSISTGVWIGLGALALILLMKK